MSKALIASACALSVLLAGCGGSSSNSAADKRKTACTKAKAAQNAYHLAGQSVGTNFLDPTADKRVIAAAAVFRARVQELEPLSSKAQAPELVSLVRILVQHEKLLGALAAHDLKTAHEYATESFEGELDEDQKNFEAICKT
jgi:hypothetical protein